jgi:hypothetical protein
VTEPHGTVAFSAARTLLQRLATTSILAPVDLTPCTIEALDRMLAHTTRMWPSRIPDPAAQNWLNSKHSNPSAELLCVRSH